MVLGQKNNLQTIWQVHVYIWGECPFTGWMSSLKILLKYSDRYWDILIKHLKHIELIVVFWVFLYSSFWLEIFASGTGLPLNNAGLES